MSTPGYGDAKIQTRHRQGARHQRLPDLDARRCSPSKVDSGPQRRSTRRFGVGTRLLQRSRSGRRSARRSPSSAIIAIIASLLVISIYIALRFEWKFAVPVLIALMHDLLITAGVYSLTGREVTTSTVAALLTILGYSLYDTIIVFDRIRENVPRMPRAAFSQIVNRSMSEVLTRSLATSFCDAAADARAAALRRRDAARTSPSRCCRHRSRARTRRSSSPRRCSTHWKEREPVYARRDARIARENDGLVPAYAWPRRRRAGRRRAEPETRRRAAARRITEPEAARAGLARRSSRSWSRDLATPRRPRRGRRAGGADGAAPDGGRRRRTARPSRATRRRPASTGAERPTSADEERRSAKRPRNRRHGRAAAMGMLAWVMMGLAIWHFTIFLPDRFWGGIVGRVPRRADRLDHLRPDRQRLHGPGAERHPPAHRARGDPGRADRHRGRLRPRASAARAAST